jgi:dipeptidyl aminopeptidase/acylaminoacyl peptidase
VDYRTSLRLTGVAVLSCLTMHVEAAPKRAITPADFNTWRILAGQALSRDGQFLAYGLFPQEGDGEVVIRNVATGKEWREPAGELPQPAPPDPNSEAPAPPRSIQLSFSQDGRTLVFLSYPRREDVEKAKADAKADKSGKAAKTKPEEELVLVDLPTQKSLRVPHVKSFQIPKKSDGFVAYQRYSLPTETAATPAEKPANDAEDAEDQRGARAVGGAAPANAEFGSVVILRKLADGTERQLADVLEYQLASDGKTLAYSVTSAKHEGDGVFVVATAGGEPRSLVMGRGRYQHLVWDEGLDELAFIGNPAGAGAPAGAANSAGGTEEKKLPYQLYLWKSADAHAEQVVNSTTPGMHAGYVLHDHAALTFSKDGSRLFFGAAPVPPPAHAGAIDEDKPSFDLWGAKDDFIQPVQKVRAAADLNRSYGAVYLVGERKMVQLGDDTLPEVTASDGGRYALGADDRSYRREIDYDDRYVDSYLVDTATGARTLLVKKHLGGLRWSGDGHYGLIFNGKDWIAIAVPSGTQVNLTAKLPVHFWNEEEDTPNTPGAYGVAGWTKDDKDVLLYDHYDVWQVAPDGSSAVNLTQGLGRREKMELRYVKLDADPEDKTIDPGKPLLLRGENTLTRDSGFYTTRIDSKVEPAKLLFAAKDFGPPIKAKNADVYVFTAQTFADFPNLYLTDAAMKNPRKVSDANPQQASLLWGSDELVGFESLDGVPLQGILYKPENFDVHKKYPMIVYLYEKLSQNLNHFIDPKPMDSLNISYYVSHGYLVFTPDIVYTTGYPGQSALKCVLGGVNAVTARGFVDEKNIGIQGHSWGGYQIAYMVTQTNRFKAAEDGAPVANMISAYDGIRWGPGRPRQFQYEKTQSRIGGTPWEYPMRFIENSPIFMVDRIHTPLLIVHNDADDAVPWYQGIEFFLALRRLDKDAWMFTYNGEPHHLRRRANQKDYAIRMAQFFDYELQGAPEPAWMQKGIPYLHTPAQMVP